MTLQKIKKIPNFSLPFLCNSSSLIKVFVIIFAICSLVKMQNVSSQIFGDAIFRKKNKTKCAQNLPEFFYGFTISLSEFQSPLQILR